MKTLVVYSRRESEYLAMAKYPEDKRNVAQFDCDTVNSLEADGVIYPHHGQAFIGEFPEGASIPEVLQIVEEIYNCTVT